MLFYELYKIIVKKVTFVGFRGDDHPLPLDLSLQGDLCVETLDSYLALSVSKLWLLKSKQQKWLWGP